MSERLIIERLEFPAHVGIVEEERSRPQPIGVDVAVQYSGTIHEAAVAQDRIEAAIDYARIARRLTEVGGQHAYQLIETMAERMSAAIFAEFSITSLDLWVRKLHPPLPDVKGSVGVRLHRTRQEQAVEPRPARFLMDVVSHIPRGRVLDVAAGRGRHALYLAGLGGFTVDAVDRDDTALAELTREAERRGLSGAISARVTELEDEAAPPDLGKETYEAAMIFFYLYRPLIPAVIRALKPGGVLIYETFLIDNHVRHQHPRRREFCLEHNELLRLTAGLRVLRYDEGEHAGSHGIEPAFTARLVAVKPVR